MKNRSISPVAGARLKLTYLYSGTALYQPGEVLGPRVLEDFEGLLVIAGNPIHETQDRTQVLEPGSVVLARPGIRETYRWDADAHTRHAYFHFNLEAIPADWPALTDWPLYCLHPERGLGEMFRHIVERAARHPDWPAKRPERSDNRIFEAFLDLYLNPFERLDESAPCEFSEPIRLAAKYMRERLDESAFNPFTLDELAHAAHVSSAHLCRVFTKELNLSPMRVCRLMQFQLAIPLLRRSSLSIKTIAERCGFPDQLYFSRNFSSTFGSSPSQLRRAMQNGAPPPPSALPQSYLFMPRVHW